METTLHAADLIVLYNLSSNLAVSINKSQLLLKNWQLFIWDF